MTSFDTPILAYSTCNNLVDQITIVRLLNHIKPSSLSMIVKILWVDFVLFYYFFASIICKHISLKHIHEYKNKHFIQINTSVSLKMGSLLFILIQIYFIILLVTYILSNLLCIFGLFFSQRLSFIKNEYSCKLLYMGWINNKILLCKTGSYV